MENFPTEQPNLIHPSWTTHYAVSTMKRRPCLMELWNVQSLPSRIVHCIVSVLILTLDCIPFLPVILFYAQCSLKQEASTLISWTTQDLSLCPSRTVGNLKPQASSLTPWSPQLLSCLSLAYVDVKTNRSIKSRKRDTRLQQQLEIKISLMNPFFQSWWRKNNNMHHISRKLENSSNKSDLKFPCHHVVHVINVLSYLIQVSCHH